MTTTTPTGQPTRRQLELLRAIHAHQQRCGYPPTYRDMCRYMHTSSPNGILSHLRGLERKGLLVREPGGPRTIRLLWRPEGASSWTVEAAGGLVRLTLPERLTELTPGEARALARALVNEADRMEGSHV